LLTTPAILAQSIPCNALAAKYLTKWKRFSYCLGLLKSWRQRVHGNIAQGRSKPVGTLQRRDCTVKDVPASLNFKRVISRSPDGN
jgi:hypothetical protein